MEKFAIGLVIGGIGGALLVANNYKMRTLIKKGQEEVQTKLDKLMDEKIEQMGDGLDKVKEKAEESVEKIKESVKEKAKAGYGYRYYYVSFKFSLVMLLKSIHPPFQKNVKRKKLFLEHYRCASR